MCFFNIKHQTSRMKKTLFIALVALLSTGAFAQAPTVDEDQLERRHEVKMNLITTIIGLAPEFSYEYALNQNMGVGARATFYLSDNGFGGNPSFVASPYFRWYFPFFFFNAASALDRNTSGFFVELSTGLGALREEYAQSPRVDGASSANTGKNGSMLFGMGVGTGYRLVMKRGWSFEGFGSIGRDFLHADETGFYGTAGITIGYMF